MKQPVTVLASITLAAGKTEADLLAASEQFQKEFVDLQPGVLRRELIRKSEREYIDIVQFRSAEDAADVMEKEKASPACGCFFAVMDLEAANEEDMGLYPSLETHYAKR